jgi:hypothetical protein
MRAALLLALTVACGKSSTSTTPSNVAPAGSGQSQATPSATPFSDAYFKGPDAGGRGGAYTYTFCADGTYVQFCLDADCDRGTWEHGAGQILLASTNPDRMGTTIKLALSADGKTLGDANGGGPYTLQGPAGDRCAR